jgi:hypothetical protein
MTRRDALLALTMIGSASLLARRAATSEPVSDARPPEGYDVLRQIPARFHESIAAGTCRSDLAAFFDAAAREALAVGQALFVPAGTYPMRTWSPPANLTVLTAGRETVFEQLATGGVPQRFIRVLADNVRLWPGGVATITGNIAVNATSFNSGIQVYADDGATIDTFVCGDVYGRDLGGDVLETGSHQNGKLNRCTIGTIYGRNIYRNIVSITAGSFGRLEGVVQLGGVGLLGLDFEPDPASGSPLESWTFGVAHCHRVSIVGDPVMPIGSVEGDELDLDYARYGSSDPPFDYGGVSETGTPYFFEMGVRYRNCDSISIKRAEISNFARGAVIDIGENAADHYTRSVRFDRLKLRNNGAKTGYEIAQQKTYHLSIGYLESNSKPSLWTATLIGGTASDSVANIGEARVVGPLVRQHTGRVNVGSNQNVRR